MEAPALRTSVFKATAVAAVAHLALDVVASRLEVTTPPYLLLDHASATFRDLLLLDRTTILVAVAFLSAGVNGAIAGLFATALAGAPRRPLALGLSLSALWVFSGGLMILVYLSPPAGVVVGSLAAGVPRAFVVAWLLERLVFRPAEEEASGAGKVS
jgi:membrane associated rhomboid family serine protease